MSSPTPSRGHIIFSGRVTNASGTGLSGICITVIEPDNDDRFRVRMGVTARDGTFSVDGGTTRIYGNWPIEYWDCNATPRYAPLQTTANVPSTGIAKNLKATLAVGAAISGVAVDQNGAPAAGACVSVHDGSHSRNAGMSPLPEYTVRTAADGRFKVSGLSSRTQKLEFGACKYSAFKTEWWKDRSNEAPAYGNFENSDPIDVTGGTTTDIGTATLERV